MSDFAPVGDLVPVRRALISVSDKTGLAEFAAALHNEFNVELISTGGTARFLRERGLPVVDVAQVTGFPEMMDGRVKTLHPKIHGGLLALRDNAEHVAAMEAHRIKPIDLVCINLYPFAETIAKPNVTFDEAIENIDIGGPSMIRSAAKNHRFVLVVTSPDRYEKVLGDLRKHNGASCGVHRLKQAQRAFAQTAEYDATIAGYLAGAVEGRPAGHDDAPARAGAVPGSVADTSARAGVAPTAVANAPSRHSIGAAMSAKSGVDASADTKAVASVAAPLSSSPAEFLLPPTLHFSLCKLQDLRYGENPHQKAALYSERKPAEASVAYATQLHGKELSYINLLDADAALSAVKETLEPAACVVKHATPCGFAIAADLPRAFRDAFAGDPLAAFGGIVALNQPVDLATAQAIVGINKLLEVIVAPSYAEDALALLKDRWKNVRLLAVGPLNLANNVAAQSAAGGDRAALAQRAGAAFDPRELHLHKIVGGYLVQERDLAGFDPASIKVVSKRPPTPAEMADLRVAWLICKHVKSNAITIAKNGMMVGSGAGQQDRVNACRIAIAKSGDRAPGGAAASDAFFPFPDGPELLLNAGVTAIIHPGGSVKDQESIDLVDQRGAAMVVTGQRHFKH